MLCDDRARTVSVEELAPRWPQTSGHWTRSRPDYCARVMSGLEQSPVVMAWWIGLSVVAVVNIAWWLAIARRVAADPPCDDPALEAKRHWRLTLSALFVLGCAFRSWLPRAEGQRICLLDSWWSNAMLGRSVATIAELALAAQVSMVLGTAARAADSPFASMVSRVLLPFIAVAEIFSWYSALTTNFIGSVVEESIWAGCATLVGIALLALRPRLRGPRRALVSAAFVLSASYVAFMATVDVPMYWRRWQADQAAGKVYLTLGDGRRDAQTRWVPTRRWEDWRQEIPWMSLYFSAGVWISLALVRTPPAAKVPAPGYSSE